MVVTFILLKGRRKMCPCPTTASKYWLFEFFWSALPVPVPVLLKAGIQRTWSLSVCRNPWDDCIFLMLLTGNRSSFPYSSTSVPIVLKLLTNKVKSTSPKHLMLELTCMQNTQYWMRYRKHYSVQKICYGNYGVIFRIWQIAWCMKCLDTGGLLGMHMSGNKITGSQRQG